MFPCVYEKKMNHKSGNALPRHRIGLTLSYAF